MIGPAGTAKSALSVELATIIQGTEYFQWLLTRFSTPDEVYETLSKIRNELRDEGIRPSDRRFKQSLSVLQAKALINQRQVVKVDDIVILEKALWETVDQKDKASLIVRSHAQDVVTRKLDRIQEEAR